MKLTFDIETDGLDATKIWCLVVQNIESSGVFKFTDEDDKYPSIADGLRLLQEADLLIAHNGIGFDALVILKLYGINLYHKKFFDTWIASQVLNYKRPHKHGLGGWGEYLKYPKFEFSDFDNYSETMMTYCARDVKVNTVIFHRLMKELEVIRAKQPLISKGLSSEMEAAKFDAYCRHYGWAFNQDKALILLDKIKSRMSTIEKIVEPKLPAVTRLIDKAPKIPK